MQKQNGFTLLDLVIVVIVIGVVAFLGSQHLKKTRMLQQEFRQGQAVAKLESFVRTQAEIRNECGGYASSFSRWVKTETMVWVHDGYQYTINRGPTASGINRCPEDGIVTESYWISADPLSEAGFFWTEPLHYGTNGEGIYSSPEHLPTTLTGRPPKATRISTSVH